MSWMSRFSIYRLLGLTLTCVAAASASCSASASYTFADLGQSDGGKLIFDAQGNVNPTSILLGDYARQQSGPYSITSGALRADSPTLAYAVTTNLPTLVIASNPYGGYYSNTEAYAVNSSGTYVGSQYNAPTSGYFGLAISYTRDGGTKLVPVPYGNPYDPPSNTILSTAFSINDAGLIVGQSANRAFLSDGTSSWDLNTLIDPKNPFVLLSATDINNWGQILGLALDKSNNTEHEYLLTPTATPEPSSLALMSVGGLIIHLVRRRHAKGGLDAA